MVQSTAIERLLEVVVVAGCDKVLRSIFCIQFCTHNAEIMETHLERPHNFPTPELGILFSMVKDK